MFQLCPHRRKQPSLRGEHCCCWRVADCGREGVLVDEQRRREALAEVGVCGLGVVALLDGKTMWCGGISLCLSRVAGVFIGQRKGCVLSVWEVCFYCRNAK